MGRQYDFSGSCTSSLTPRPWQGIQRGIKELHLDSKLEASESIPKKGDFERGK